MLSSVVFAQMWVIALLGEISQLSALARKSLELLAQKIGSAGILALRQIFPIKKPRRMPGLNKKFLSLICLQK